ncbi:hypothetical protein G6R40_09625 [Chryseobacterium sp. POL2]|uniref:hypothetical protein n=1 Tax=Chryseobacterium sp. POL2 TaxID=2713414 RepID=UPI0013E17C40|nr:hypothetical protein [Chryseobacterium sp. POL2]QIG89903.1 hypothetical protein G6R40_09625 [Chryseobacterium sp. POL2]
MNSFINLIRENGFEIEFVKPNLTEFTSNFALQDKMILFFDLENDYPLRNFLDYCYKEDVEAYSKEGLQYILLHRKNLSLESKNVIDYFLPQIKSISNFSSEFLKLTSTLNEYNLGDGYEDFSNTYHSLYKEILYHNGYSGDIKSGFVFKKNHKVYVVGFSYDNFFQNPKTPLELIADFIGKEDQVLNSRHNVDPKQNIYSELDDETKEQVKAFELQLEDLKNSGKLLLVLPILKKMMEKKVNNLDLNLVSSIFIDFEYRITLPYFNNLEVKMSNLTKAVYILFYENPDGINLNNLHNYKEQLRKIYFDICLFDDVDKMNQSITDLVDIRTKAIYTHISRIKSAFQKVMDYDIAQNYIIKSDYHGGSLKYIPILRTVDDSDYDLDALQALM